MDNISNDQKASYRDKKLMYLEIYVASIILTILLRLLEDPQSKFFKISASLCFLINGLQKKGIEAAALCGFFGDALLVEDDLFILGVMSFIMGHLAYIYYFLNLDLNLHLTIRIMPILLLIDFAVIKQLNRHLKGNLWFLVMIYIVMLTIFVLFSTSTPSNFLGAICSYISDYFVIRDMVVKKSKTNFVIGLPFYYFSQYFL